MLSWTLSNVDTQILRGIRCEFSQALRERGTHEPDVEAGTIILGELLANACEHGRLPVHIALYAKNDRLQLTVADSGSGIKAAVERPAHAVRGRGFAIVERLGARITIAPGPPSIIEVVLPLRSSYR